MLNHCLAKLPLSNVESKSERPAAHSRVPLDAVATVSAPLITYIDPIELAQVDRGVRSSGRKTSQRKCRRCRSIRRGTFSARARRERRRVIAQLDVLPSARRARAAGLYGAALRAYVIAVAAVDGPAALME
jgi:hypothetical protein